VRRVTSRGPGVKGAPGVKNPAPRHKNKRKVRTQSPENFRPDPKGRATGSRFTWRGKLHHKASKSQKALMDSVRKQLGGR